MSTPNTPFKISQPIDQVLYVMKRTHRRRLAIKIGAREGTFLIDARRKSNAKVQKEVQKELQGLSIDMKQNFTIWFYFSDCTLKFKRYRGLNGKGHNCFRIIHIDDAVSKEKLFSEPVVQKPMQQSVVQQPAQTTL